MRILILGASGTLGKSMMQSFSSNPRLKVLGTTTGKRNREDLELFEWPKNNLDDLILRFSPKLIINLAAKLNSKTLDSNLSEKLDAYKINSELPLALNKFANDICTLHMSTDAVFKGNSHMYNERSQMDGVGVYARSKIQGELNLQSGKIIRCSILGRSLKKEISIPNLLLNQPRNSEMQIIANEYWNGLTADGFAEFIHTIIQNDLYESLNPINHLTPSNYLTKYELFQLLAIKLGRTDLRLVPFYSEHPQSRLLETLHKSKFEAFWKETSFKHIPSIEELIQAANLN